MDAWLHMQQPSIYTKRDGVRILLFIYTFVLKGFSVCLTDWICYCFSVLEAEEIAGESRFNVLIADFFFFFDPIQNACRRVNTVTSWE